MAVRRRSTQRLAGLGSAQPLHRRFWAEGPEPGDPGVADPVLRRRPGPQQAGARHDVHGAQAAVGGRPKLQLRRKPAGGAGGGLG